MESKIFIAIIIACVILIAVCVIKRRPDIVLNFGLRAFIGTAGIYALDFILRTQGYDINVGINAVTFATNGFLGLPGFLLLYGLAFYYSL